MTEYSRGPKILSPSTVRALRIGASRASIAMLGLSGRRYLSQRACMRNSLEPAGGEFSSPLNTQCQPVGFIALWPLMGRTSWFLRQG